MFEIFTTSSTKSLLILAILTFLYFLENFDRYLIAVAPIPYIDYSSYEYSVLAGPAFAVVYTVGGLFFALGYTDYLQQDSTGNARISKFAVLSFSTFTFSFAFGATAFAVTFWQQVIIRIIMGLAQSIITPFSTSLIRDYFPVELIGSALGIFNTGTYFAFALSLSLGIFIYTNYGWQAGYMWFGLIGMGGSLLLPLLSCFKLEHSPRNTNGSDSVYKVLTAEDLDISRGGSDERPSFFLYDNQGGKKASISSVSSTSSIGPRVTHLRNPMHTYVTDLVDEPNSINTINFNNENNTRRSVDGQSPPTSSKSKPTLTASTVASSTASSNLFSRMGDAIKEIALVYWWNNSGIYLLCLATGIRLGAGYILSSYTGVFFADLFLKEEDSIHCLYSYNPDYTHYDTNTVCDADYPYCVSGDCNALNQYPWHNQGMSAEKIESYMSWVPLVGSALGSFLGGLISDKISSLYDASEKSSTGRSCGSRYSIRALICGITTLLSLPLVVLSFFLDYPGCFLIYIASGIIGEVYLGQSLAVIADPGVIPPRLLTSSVALFMLVVTVIGGNSPLLIPFVESTLTYSDTPVTFNAQSMFNTTSVPMSEKFNVMNSNADTLLYSLLYSLIGCYALSGILYLVAYMVMLHSK